MPMTTLNKVPEVYIGSRNKSYLRIVVPSSLLVSAVPSGVLCSFSLTHQSDLICFKVV